MLELGLCKMVVATSLTLISGDGPVSQDFLRYQLKQDHYYEIQTEVTFLQSRADAFGYLDTDWTYSLKIEPADYQLANWNSSEKWGSFKVQTDGRPIGIIGVDRDSIKWTYDFDLASIAVPAQSNPPLYGMRVVSDMQDGEQKFFTHQGRVSFLTTRAAPPTLVLNLTRDNRAGYVFTTWYPSVRIAECSYKIVFNDEILKDGFEKIG